MDGALNIEGAISADGSRGLTGGSGGGAGGSLWITTAGLSGSGSITADGAPGELPNGGGGGGGRVAVYYTSNSYTGIISAKGGAGYVNGGAGTIYLKPAAQSFGQVIIDNGGLSGTNTYLTFLSAISDLAIQGTASAYLMSPLTVRDLNVFPGSTLTISNRGLTITRNARVQAGAAIHANGLGYGPGLGTGSGSASQNPRGGGSHAGLGGANPNAVASGNLQSPNTFGSGGGNGSGSSSLPPLGGSGGGAIQINVTGELTVDGTISANGGPGGANSGGGAGGSLWLTIGTLTGSGAVSANGGPGNGSAGGGGGGRVAVLYATNLYTGLFEAAGGAGLEAGGAGTIYLEQSGAANRLLVVNNGSLRGAKTPLYGLPSALNLRVSGGGTAYGQEPFPLLETVTIGSGAAITYSYSAPFGPITLDLAALGDFTIEAGGALSVDAYGYPNMLGPGAGALLNGEGGGGGHGGAGGASMLGAAGGPTYDSLTEPAQKGSGGGGTGSTGGGALRLKVGGMFNVRGIVSADANPAVQDASGGGSGGSIWVTAGAITGDGAITARGGDGEPFNGGGGGGGRIALYSPANTFTGLVSVIGGLGANPGEDGTVHNAALLPGLNVVSQSPAQSVSNLVQSVLLNFSEPLDPNSVHPQDFVLATPIGLETNLTVTLPTLSSVQVGFPVKNIPGDYQISAGPEIQNLFGVAMSQVYTGAFSIVLGTISGAVTDTNGQPVPGVLLSSSGSLPPAITDASGRYFIGAPPDWTGTVTPAFQSFMFAPGKRSFTNFANSPTGQDFVMIETIAPRVSWRFTTTNVVLSWHGLPGVSYQVWGSTNLWIWYPLDIYDLGTNGPLQLTVPTWRPAQEFYKISASN